VKKIVSILLTLALACTSTVVGAHKPSDAYLTLATRDTQVDVRWDVALRDLDNELGLDANDDGQLTWGEVHGRGRDIAALMLPALRLETPRGPCTLVQALDASALAGTPPGSGAVAAPGVALQLDQHSDGSLGNRGSRRLEIAERNQAEAGCEGSKAVAILLFRRKTDHRRGAAVKISLGDDDFRRCDAFDLLAPSARRLDRRLHSFGAAVHRQRRVQAGQLA